MLKRCEISLRHLSYKSTYDLPIVHFADEEMGTYFSKIEKNRLFFQLKKAEKTYIVEFLLDFDDKSYLIILIIYET